jgi:hypothetical protein
VRTLSRKRPPGDANKHEEFCRAVRDLEHAHRFFQQLHGLGKASGLDARKLQQHINFIADTHTKSLVGGARVAAGGREGGAGKQLCWQHAMLMCAVCCRERAQGSWQTACQPVGLQQAMDSAGLAAVASSAVAPLA